MGGSGGYGKGVLFDLFFFCIDMVFFSWDHIKGTVCRAQRKHRGQSENKLEIERDRALKMV